MGIAGIGSISTETGVLREAPYGFKARFEGGKGTNPEELIGAAHAACFTMALSLILGEANLKADALDTSARVSLDKLDDGYAITAIHLTLKGKVPGADQATFQSLADKAKAKPAQEDSPFAVDRTAKLYIGGKQARPDSAYSYAVTGAKVKLGS